LIIFDQTFSVDKQVTDSAASATALFSGVKTIQGALGLDATASIENCRVSPNDVFEDVERLPPRRHWGHKSVTTMLDWAQSVGKKTGKIADENVVKHLVSCLLT
jgi:alkaline phosphatase